MGSPTRSSTTPSTASTYPQQARPPRHVRRRLTTSPVHDQPVGPRPLHLLHTRSPPRREIWRRRASPRRAVGIKRLVMMIDPLAAVLLRPPTDPSKRRLKLRFIAKAWFPLTFVAVASGPASSSSASPGSSPADAFPVAVHSANVRRRPVPDRRGIGPYCWRRLPALHHVEHALLRRRRGRQRCPTTHALTGGGWSRWSCSAATSVTPTASTTCADRSLLPPPTRPPPPPTR